MGAAYLKAPDIAVMQRCRKIPYENRRLAAKLMKSFSGGQRDIDRGQGVLNVYRCPYCGAWHIGHS
jgi:hypothetical protein